MRKLLTILFLFPLICFGQKIVINGTAPKHLINGTGIPTQINEIWDPEVLPDSVTYQIEYKAVSSEYASEITLIPGINTVDYNYYNHNDILIGSGSVSTPTTDRPMGVVQSDVFVLLGLSVLQTMEFFESSDGTNYWAFGNLIDVGWPDFPWYGRRGLAHLGGGRIGYQPYSTLNRSFGTRVVTSHANDGTDIRGGSAAFINDTAFVFTAFYEDADTFKCLTVTKYLPDGTFINQDTLLWKVGGHGGVNETTWERFNFYGAPVNPVGTAKWFIPWYEHQNGVIWRVNYLYSDDNFAHWQNINIDTNQVGETAMAHLGGDTLLVLGRFDANVPLYQNLSFDLGTTWEGWVQTNLGSGTGRAMAAVLNTPEHGVVVVYGDRTTNNVMLTKDNVIADIVASPTAWQTPEIIYTTGNDDLYHPLAYPSILRVAQYRYLIIFSEHNPDGISDGQARLKMGDGRLP